MGDRHAPLKAAVVVGAVAALAGLVWFGTNGAVLGGLGGVLVGALAGNARIG